MLRSVLRWLRHFTAKLHYAKNAYYKGVICTDMSIRNRLLSLIVDRGIKYPSVLEDPSELDWPDNWGALHYDDIPKFTRELNKEICKDHILYGLPLCALGRCQGNDNFLFQIESAAEKFALVHLTWRKETDPRWPTTMLFNSFEEVIFE